MFIGLDGINTKLTKPVNTTDTVLHIADTSACDTLGTNHSYLVISDGTKSEIVEVKCSNGLLTMVRTHALTFAVNACVRYQVVTKAICDLIKQGGCTATESCTPIGEPVHSFPSAIVGKDWAGLVTFNNGVSLEVTHKPDWATPVITANTVTFKGIPNKDAVAFTIVGRGCNGSISTFAGYVDVCEPIGVA